METTDSIEPSTKKTWLGSSITDICQGIGRWSFSVPPVVPAKYHHVLYQLPVSLDHPPEPHLGTQYWDDDHVRLPYSDKNLFPTSEGGVDVIKCRWKLICKSLSKPINSSRELELAINSYNSSLPTFSALHNFFEEVLDEEEAEFFFSKILPPMVKLALKLPEIIPSNIPLLKQGHSKSVSLSQLQIACLLCNAFFCTFPWKKTTAATYPGVNFVRLFSAHERPKRHQAVAEKLKCLCNYFRRVTQKYPVGTVTFERKFIPRSNMPRWDTLENNLGNTRIHINSEGIIEDDGHGFLQVDFANKNIGGGVLGYGCVQEEIRFVLCPELIVGRLFVEQLNNNEAVIIIGAERYNDYSGYGDSFLWTGSHVDQTPYDEYNRRKTSICVIDATKFNKTEEQFRSSSVLRELNKAYVGFHSREKEHLAPVATGNWGCGAFGGSKKFKSIIQLMACSAANRYLVYYSFGDEEIRDQFYNLHLFLASNRITIGQLWRYLCLFATSNLKEEQLFSFIQQAFFDNKKPQQSINNYFPKIEKKKDCNSLESQPSTSRDKSTPDFEKLSKNKEEKQNRNKNEELCVDLNEIYDDKNISVDSDEIIPNSQPETEKFMEFNKRPSIKKTKLSSEEIKKKLPTTNVIKLLSLLDSESIDSSSSECTKSPEKKKKDQIDTKQVKSSTNNNSDTTGKPTQEIIDEKMDIECGRGVEQIICSPISSCTSSSSYSIVKETQVTKRKISDYFNKISNK